MNAWPGAMEAQLGVATCKQAATNHQGTTCYFHGLGHREEGTRNHVERDTLREQREVIRQAPGTMPCMA